MRYKCNTKRQDMIIIAKVRFKKAQFQIALVTSVETYR